MDNMFPASFFFVSRLLVVVDTKLYLQICLAMIM
jgi:hypothetical protein